MHAENQVSLISTPAVAALRFNHLHLIEVPPAEVAQVTRRQPRPPSGSPDPAARQPPTGLRCHAGAAFCRGTHPSEPLVHLPAPKRAAVPRLLLLHPLGCRRRRSHYPRRGLLAAAAGISFDSQLQRCSRCLLPRCDSSLSPVPVTGFRTVVLLQIML